MNVGRVLFRAALTQPITVYRQNGSWIGGRWTPGSPLPIPMQAVVNVPSGDTLDMLSQADQESGAIEVFVPAPLHLELTQATGTSDQIQWNGDTYRVMHVWDWSANGYVKALAVKMTTTTEA